MHTRLLLLLLGSCLILPSGCTDRRGGGGAGDDDDDSAAADDDDAVDDDDAADDDDVDPDAPTILEASTCERAQGASEICNVGDFAMKVSLLVSDPNGDLVDPAAEFRIDGVLDELEYTADLGEGGPLDAWFCRAWPRGEVLGMDIRLQDAAGHWSPSFSASMPIPATPGAGDCPD